MVKNYEWKKIEKEFHESKLSLGAFSRKHKIPLSTLSRHIRMCEGYENTNSSAKDISDAVEIVPVKVISKDNETIKNPAPIIITAGIFRIEINEDYEPNVLKSILQIIGALCYD